jgi:hypothetical protein
MFDGPPTAGEAVWDAPAVALDLSALRAGSTGSDLAMSIEMVCGSAFLDAKRSRRAREAEARGPSAPKVIRVNDEAWRAPPIAGLGEWEYYQAAVKLSRDTASSTGWCCTAHQTSRPRVTRAAASSASPRA